MFASWFIISCLGILVFDIVRFSSLERICTPAIKTNASKRTFKVYWNIPTFMCRQYGMYFAEIGRNFNIIQNEKDQFRGNHVAILYDPGAFPALLKGDTGRLFERNGGVPQEGNLTYHLELFTRHVNEQIKDPNFAGLAVIDFESWRPIWRQNWASLDPYRELSLKIERRKHPSWSKSAIQNKAVENFEKYGKFFMEQSIRIARSIRPLAKWSYYAYPYCFNLSPNQPHSYCHDKVLEENDRLSWLFGEENMLLPSVYLRFELSPSNRMGLIQGRVREAVRVARNVNHKIDILPYFWYKYQDKRDVFLSREDVRNGFEKIFDEGANGLVLWGSSMDVNSKIKCHMLMNYANDVLGPEVLRITQSYFGKDQVQPVYEIINESEFDNQTLCI